MENNTIEKTYVDVLSDLVDRGYVDRSVDYVNKYANANDSIMPIGYWIAPAMQALDKLSNLTSRLCDAIGQIEFEDNHKFIVFYPAVITDSDLMSALKPIYTESIFVHERDFIKTSLDKCLANLNDGYVHIAYHVNYVDYKDDRLILTLIATRKDNKDKNQ